MEVGAEAETKTGWPLEHNSREHDYRRCSDVVGGSPSEDRILRDPRVILGPDALG